MAAYRAAIEQGADGIECDVRLTADGHLVCVHDRRVDRTTNGRGVVSTLELADLAALDFAARHDEWRDFEDPARSPTTTGRPWSRSTNCSGSWWTPDGGSRSRSRPSTRRATPGWSSERWSTRLRRFGLAAPSGGDAPSVFVMSFSWIGLRRVRALAPRIPTVLLMDRVPLRMRDGSLPVGRHRRRALDRDRPGPSVVRRARAPAGPRRVRRGR